MYRTWGIDDLYPGRGQTIDIVTRRALGMSFAEMRLRTRETLEADQSLGLTPAEISLMVDAIQPPSTALETEEERQARQELWDGFIKQSRQRRLQLPPSATQTPPLDTDFADPQLEQDLISVEESTRGQFLARVYADQRIWEMGLGARRTLADQELAYSRYRFQTQRGALETTRGESSRAAEERETHQVEVVPSQRTIAQRVVQAPRPRTQRASYAEDIVVDSDDEY